MPLSLALPPVARARPGRLGRASRGAYAVLGVVLVAFIGSRLGRSADSYWTWLDGWVVDAIEVGGCVLCLARPLLPGRGRAATCMLGAALGSWTAGDIVTTVQSIGGATAPSPGLADVFYVAFYPLAYAAILLFLRRELKGVAAPSWLDGLVAGLGAATVCAGFGFHRIVDVTGSGTLSTLVNLAYPVGDLLLFGLVIGGTTVIGGARKWSWLLLAGGCALNVAGDTGHLLGSALGSGWTSSFLDAVAWPASILIMSASVWFRPKSADLHAAARPTSLFLPHLALTSSLVVLVVGTLRPMSRVAVALATSTLLTAGIRLAMSRRRLWSQSQQRHHESVTDELTGLANRRYLFRVLDEFFAGYDEDVVPDPALAFLFVDLNNFKEINDSFGHPCGDELLRQLGPRLAGCLRPSDLLVRLGGDEFAVVLMDGDAGYAVDVARRLTAGLEGQFDLGDVRVSVGASIGIAVAPSHARAVSDLVGCADMAMYRAKAAGAAYAVFEEGLDSESRLRSAGELRTAIEKGHLVLHYQPQLDVRSGLVTGVEALIRWAHPRLGLLAPETFLPVAQEAGLMRSVTAFVLEEALSQCAAWLGAGRRLVVSVNVSAANLLEPGFTALIRHLLTRHGVPAELLVVEITETSVILDLQASGRVIEELRDLGLVVSIDDFGAGFTSLAHLGSLAVGELKLDRLFVAALAGDRPRDAELVGATIDLAHAMGLRVVVEGVEDRLTLGQVTDLGCDRVQGYFICRPQPARDLVVWLDSEHRGAGGQVPPSALLPAAVR